jgi:hypothetical protein
LWRYDEISIQIKFAIFVAKWEKYIYLIVMKKSLNSDGQEIHRYINKTNNHLSPQLTEHKKDHNI